MVMTAAGAGGNDDENNASDDDEQGLAADIEAGRSLVSHSEK
jgi:hypothetical protein